jgi:hypothetical protein
VYIFCILPNSISRWLSFSGFNVPYQFSLSANTLFSLSGMFNAILFFLTRPELVVGPSDSPQPIQASTNGPQIQSHHHRDETELTSYSSQKFQGSLRTRSPVSASHYVAPDLEYNDYFPPYNSMLPPEGGSSSRASPKFARDSDVTSHVTSNISGERSYGDFRPTVVSAPVEVEETYRRPPG